MFFFFFVRSSMALNRRYELLFALISEIYVSFIIEFAFNALLNWPLFSCGCFVFFILCDFIW